MAQSISAALARIKQELDQLITPQQVEQICREHKHVYRTRKLDPLTTIRLFAQQVLNGNTAISHLPRLSKMRFDPSAYCDARARLPLGVLEALLRHTADAGRDELDANRRGLWLGCHRTWLLDGSSCSMPDTPALQAVFGQPGMQKPGVGFPVAHLLAMFDAYSGMVMDVIAAPLRTADFAQAPLVHPLMGAGDIAIADRAFCSYVHVALLAARGVHAVFRLHQRIVAPFDRPQAQDGRQDQLVEWRKPAKKPPWMTDQAAFDALPATMTVRVLRYRVGDRGCRTREVTLITTLLDATLYAKAKLARLFGIRWRVEQDLRDLKITLRMDVLRCKTPDGVRKELAVYALVYNLVCLVRQRAAAAQRVREPHRISFTDVMRWLQTAAPDEPLPRFIVNPRRPRRHEPRAYKRRHKEYDRMNKPRAEYKKQRQSRRQNA